MKLVRVGERETWCHWKRDLEDEGEEMEMNLVGDEISRVLVLI